MFRWLLIFGWAGVAVPFAPAQTAAQLPARAEIKRLFAPDPEFSSSRSGQFGIHAAPRTGWLPQLGNATNVVRLERSLLAVSCERVKAALLARLGLRDTWRGRILIDLYPARRLDETIVINSVFSGSDWSYRVELPDTLEKERFTAALAEVLLREIANRKSDGRGVEIPAWFAAGLARDLLQSATADLILDPPNQTQRGVTFSPVLRDQRHPDPLRYSREQLGVRPPLTFAELSWPAEEQFAGAAQESFRSSAQLFVSGLLEFPDGSACLRGFLDELPQHLNWQISFRNAFRPHFASTLDLEKWWALRVVDFTARDLGQTWPWEVSWQKLDEILRTPVEIRTRPDELPLRTELPLQIIIAEWDLTRQDPVLRDKSKQLLLLRTHVSQELIRLVDDYRQALGDYLAARNPSQYVATVREQTRVVVSSHVRETVRELDQLDARREQLRLSPPASGAPAPEGGGGLVGR